MSKKVANPFAKKAGGAVDGSQNPFMSPSADTSFPQISTLRQPVPATFLPPSARPPRCRPLLKPSTTSSVSFEVVLLAFGIPPSMTASAPMATIEESNNKYRGNARPSPSPCPHPSPPCPCQSLPGLATTKRPSPRSSPPQTPIRSARHGGGANLTRTGSTGPPHQHRRALGDHRIAQQ